MFWRMLRVNDSRVWRAKKILIAVVAVAVASLVFAAQARAESKTEYFRELLKKKQATVGDAIHAVSRYKDYDGPVSMEKELLFLYDKGIKFRPDIMKIGDLPLTKGNGCHMLLTAMNYKGGVMFRLFPSSQRFALREAIYMEMVKGDSTVSQVMTGGELLTLLSRVVEITRQQEKEEKE